MEKKLARTKYCKKSNQKTERHYNVLVTLGSSILYLIFMLIGTKLFETKNIQSTRKKISYLSVIFI